MPPWIPLVASWALPSGGAILQVVLARRMSNLAKGWLAVISAALGLIALLSSWSIPLRGDVVDFRLAVWDGPLALIYRLDGLGFLFALIALAVGSVILLFSIEYMKEESGASRFYALMLLFIAAFVHLVFSADWFVLYLSWEVIGLCSFFLIGFWYTQAEAARGARKALVMTHIAGYGLLAFGIVLYARTGVSLWIDPRFAAGLTSGVLLLALLAAMAKSVQFPLHTWIPDAMAAPTPVSALLHAACYVTAGVYLIARLRGIAPWPPLFQGILIAVAILTMVVGALFALLQTDLKRLLAFSTVSQVGYMMLGLGIGTPLGVAAGLLLCFNHALFKGGLFLCAGKIQHECGTRDMNRLGGLVAHMPLTTFNWLVLAASLSGLPLLSGFVSKWLLYHAALQAGQLLAAVVAWLVSVLTVFYFLKASSSIFFGESQTGSPHSAPNPWMERAIGVLAGGSVLLGIAPQLAFAYLINPLLPHLGLAPIEGITWLGIRLAGGEWYVSSALVMAVLALGIGALVYLIWQPARRIAVSGGAAILEGGGVFSGGEPLSGSGRLSAGDFTQLIQDQWEGFYRWADPDRYYRALWRFLLRFGQGVESFSQALEKRAGWALVGFGVLCALLLLLFTPALSAETGISHHTPLWFAGWLGIAGLGCLTAAFCVALRPNQLLLLLLAILTALGGLLTPSPMLNFILLEGAALLAFGLLWLNLTDKKAAQAYLLAVLLSAAFTLSALQTVQAQPALALAFLLVGIGIKIALVPFYVWLPRLAVAAPAPFLGLIIGVVDVAAFAEMVSFSQRAPALFGFALPWIVFGLLSAFGGALAMLAQRDLKRLLAFSTLEDMGILILAVALGQELGTQAAYIGAAAHAVGKVLLFVSLSRIEADGNLMPSLGGLARVYPFSSAGFVVGFLAVLGAPPFVGYLARWRIYLLSFAVSPWLLAGLLLCSSLALLAYGRTLVTFWWGSGTELSPAEGKPLVCREPLGFRLTVSLLILLLLLGGLLPALLLS
ncbi:MAG: proton-conducting transporter membrane subunit [Anaerolineales bacterium]|nr:proton-conducting transporter membrane subunit [Anaerolineales bacterium]